MVILMFQSSFVYAEEGVICMFDGDCASDRSVHFSDRVECRIQNTGSANLCRGQGRFELGQTRKVSRLKVGEKETFVVVINFGNC